MIATSLFRSARSSLALAFVFFVLVSAQRASCDSPLVQSAPTPAPKHRGFASCGNAFLQLAPSGGDLYSEFANDGEESNGSYNAEAGLACGSWSGKFEMRVSHYLTENAGPGTMTLFCTLDGGSASVPFFRASEATADVRLEHGVGRDAFDVGVAWVTTSTNYGYPRLTGPGFGLEKFPSVKPGLRAYGSVFYFPAATGDYHVTQAGSPNLGQTIHSSFSVVLADVGVVWRTPSSRAYLYLGYNDEVRSPNGGPICMLLIRSDPYAGIGVRF